MASAKCATTCQSIRLPPVRRSSLGRTVLGAEPMQIADVKADPEYTMTDVTEVGFRTILGVPMLREGNPIGVIV